MEAVASEIREIRVEVGFFFFKCFFGFLHATLAFPCCVPRKLSRVPISSSLQSVPLAHHG